MLGVRADSDYTLEITLSQPNRQLPELLASSAAMPCNQAFYESTRGRYGLDVDTLMSNGPFYVSIWNNDTAIALRRSEVYREDLAGRCGCRESAQQVHSYGFRRTGAAGQTQNRAL